MSTRATSIAALAFVALTHSAHAEGEAAAPLAAPSAEPDPHGPRWLLEGGVYAYFVPEASDYLQPTLRAERGFLHLETRYSYEDLMTGSAWAGLKVTGGEEVWWELVSMLGVVFGRTNGVAPGYEGAIGWWKLELYSEGEFVLDFDPAAEAFFFDWSELTAAPVDWFRVGLLTQRTRVFSSGRALERGLLAGLTWEPATLTLHVLNPDDARPIFIVSLGASF